MGSFANSIYVRSTSPQAVADAVQQVMAGEGYTPTDEELDEMSMQGMGGNLRGIDVSEPHGGWVCVLDSDLACMLEFTPSLARHLNTAAITALVNDSDSWCYFLYDGEQQIDAFDSSGGLEAMDELIDLEELDPNDFSARMSSLEADIGDRFPTEIREIQARAAAGKMQPGDMAKLQEWMETGWPKLIAELTGDVNQLIHDFDDGEVSGRISPVADDGDAPIDDETMQEHVALLRPYLPLDVTDRQLQQVLEKRAVFAEELLAEFLELLGVGGFGANLSYRYAREYGDEELAQSGWPFPWQFRFRSGGRPAFRIFG
ncbi:MAG TPA: hypothetical protein VHB77_22370 [Planctomycetaceae bacterium]|nr:hypothetical protein [Planctomycetaceae bacterium]